MTTPGWEFDPLPANLVEQEPTQRDQFNNDEVTLGEAVVREVIQNSTDAAANGAPVKVRFAIRDVPPADAPAFRALFDGLRPHLRACGIDPSVIDSRPPRVLVIEDFNTRGLTGDPGALDNGNFHNFWRRHGKSVKTGRAGGRWGLGKLVYSSASEIRAFFGLTFRDGDGGPLLMGQSVLTNHEIGTTRHVAHGFWFAGRNDRQMQLPLSDPAQIAPLARLLGVTRDGQSGLSLVIPWLDPRIDEDVLVQGVIRHYYFPILAGRLTVEVGTTVIDRDTFPGIVAAADVPATDAPRFGFVGAVSGSLQRPPAFTAGRPLAKQNLTELFSADDIAAMKTAFTEGRLVHARVPVRLRPKTGPDQDTWFDLFLQKLPDGARPFALFARGSITVPGEARYFGSAQAFGALVGLDEPMVAFLGDAENPAHTVWNGSAEKLNANWRTPGPTLAAIRHSLRALYDAVTELTEREDRNALIDFFSLADQAQSSSGRKKRTPVPRPDIPPGEKGFRILKSGPGAFAIVPGPGAEKWNYPKPVRVRVAYDLLGANPFRKHSKYDFDLGGKGIDIATENMEIRSTQPNVLVLSATGPEFRLEASGFDVNRDLVVDARAQT